MKKLALALFFLFIVNNSYSQKYHKFVEDNKIWNLDKYPAGYGPIVFTLIVKLSDDTVIENKTYKKTDYVSRPMTAFYPDSNQIIRGSGGFIREDSNKKVFIRYDSSEELLYDFSIGVGDSMILSQENNIKYDTFIVSTIDSVLVINEYRKRFLLNSIHCYDNNERTWIEGIGDLDGLFFWGYENCYTLGGRKERISCVFENNNLVYQKSIYDTCLYLNHIDSPIVYGIGMQYDNNNVNINIYPNPIIDVSIFVINNLIITDEYVLEIFNPAGIKVRTISIIGNTTTIKKSQFGKGIYLYKLKGKNNQYSKTGKLVFL